MKSISTSVKKVHLKVNIAVVTAFGKAYYRLVSELKKERIPFITVKPNEIIPLNVKLVITTKSEKQRVCFPIILFYDETMDPSIIVEEALQMIRGKHRYNNLIIGIDPGKDFGIAAIGDRIVLQTNSTSDVKKVADEVLRMIIRYDGDRKTVKIGNGADVYRTKLIRLLGKLLPSGVNMESVDESGTTKSVNVIQTQRNSQDTFSAIKISMRKGYKIIRTNERIES